MDENLFEVDRFRKDERDAAQVKAEKEERRQEIGTFLVGSVMLALFYGFVWLLFEWEQHSWREFCKDKPPVTYPMCWDTFRENQKLEAEKKGVKP